MGYKDINSLIEEDSSLKDNLRNMSKRSKNGGVVVKSPKEDNVCAYAEAVSGRNKNDKETKHT